MVRGCLPISYDRAMGAGLAEAVPSRDLCLVITAAVLVPTTIVAMVVFAYKDHIDWTVGAIMGGGSVIGANLDARPSHVARGQKYFFYLIVFVISAELVNLT